MKTIIITINLLLLFLTSLTMYGQGRYDVRFVQMESTQSGIALVDIEIKAHDSTTEFYLADQNYRFSCYRTDILFNPGNTSSTFDVPSTSIVEELEVSGLVEGPSIYGTHTLTGSLDTIISYNVELNGGSGLYVTTHTWIKVGRLAFELTSPDVELRLVWHQQTDFPATFVSERINGQLIPVQEGDYYDLNSTSSFTVDAYDINREIVDIEVFPNPVYANMPFNVKIDTEEPGGQGRIAVKNGLGQTIYTESVNLTTSNELIEVRMNGVPPGVYWLSLETDDWTSHNHPIIVKM